MANPLLSIIIPTYNRPTLLSRAVDSALAGVDSNEIEVIVIPNGPDLSWQISLAKYADNPTVRVFPIAVAHGNVARNHGLANARGKYVRFLDDDDFLLQPAAMEQVYLLERTGAEVCSGLVMNIDQDLSELGLLTFPETRDFVAATLTLSGFSLPVGNVFLHQALLSVGASWRIDAFRAQDLMWMLDLTRIKDWDWQHLSKPVGAWFQHDTDRVSTVRLSSDKPTQVIDALFELQSILHETNRMTEERLAAWCHLLWNYIHWRIPYDVPYWTGVARRVANIAPESRPDHPIFEHWLLRRFHPVFAEFILAYPRKLSSWLRERKRDLIGWDYRRRL